MKKGLKIKYVCFLFVCSILLIGFIITVFKYSYSIYTDQVKWDYNYESGSMYISSDFLTYDDNGYFNFLSYDQTDLNFMVYNYESDSQISTYDIEYDISCSTKSGFTCKIDNNISEVTGVNLNKSFTCLDSSLTEEECKNSSKLSYNKVTNNHTVSVVPTSPSFNSSTSVEVTLTTTKPYKTVLKGFFKVRFIDDVGFKIVPVETSNSRCKFSVTNYGNSYSEVTATTATGAKFVDGTTTYSTYLSKYQRIYLEVFKSSANTPCSDVISVS